MPKGAVLHVGCNTSDNVLGPLFPDGTFKYIPIRENHPSRRSWTYEVLGLKDWVPQSWKYAHYDPEFLTCTWGDYANIRTHWARQLRPGDYYFFISSLRYQPTAKGQERNIENDWAYCLIGFFEVDKRPRKLSYPLPETAQRRYANNAHLRRAADTDDEFLLFTGTNKSRLLRRAIPISSNGRFPNELARKAMPHAKWDSPRWWQELVPREGVKFLLGATKS